MLIYILKKLITDNFMPAPFLTPPLISVTIYPETENLKEGKICGSRQRYNK